eukprot:m.630291 g.630291  ORF g.630291 m.630291 type:complete len:107 (+) comp22565_c2_seq23:1064-1384(+)
MPSSVSVSYSDILGDTTWGCGGRLMHFALHYAAKYGNSEVVELLLEATVPVSAHQRTEWISRFLDAKKTNGHTAADVARDKNHPTIADKIDRAKRTASTTQAVSQV